MLKKKKGRLILLFHAFVVTICIFILPIAIMNFTLIVKSYINPNKVPDFFGIKPFIVLTGSMEPAINGGDLIISKTVNPANLKVGNIISFKENSGVVTHRIDKITKNNDEIAFITKGDANNARDMNPISYSQVEGNYLFKIPKLGFLAMFMQTPIGMLSLIGIPALGIIIYEFSRQKREFQKEFNKNRITRIIQEGE